MKKILLLFFSLLFYTGMAKAQEKIWKGIGVSHGNQVTLEAYLAEDNPEGRAVIICAGGSYFWLDQHYEGDSVAYWLQQNGISAFVLRYRTAGYVDFALHYRSLFRGNRHPDMITDAQRALQWVREHAEEYHVNPDKVGMIGFSAGGHLVMSAACYHDVDFLQRQGITTEVSLKPTFVAAIYPVVTMYEPYVHKRSRRGLMGRNRNFDEAVLDTLSLERHIPADCPPVFIANCVDDPVVDYHNSVLLDSALTVANINHRYLQFATGGHGFGTSERKGSKECHAWKQEFLKWLSEIDF